MILATYIVLFAAILVHLGFSIKNLLLKPRAVWNYDKQALLVLAMLLLIAATNAMSAFKQGSSSQLAMILKMLFGQGQTGGIMQLGFAGIYWTIVFLFSGITRLRYPMPEHLKRDTAKLPPGGLLTVGLSMAVIVFLVGLMIWGTT